MNNLTMLPPRAPLIRQMFYLLRRADIDDWEQWATDLLGSPITDHRTLTSQDTKNLIDELVLNVGEPRACRAYSSNDLACMHKWPGHPLFCTDTDGTEWLAREI